MRGPTVLPTMLAVAALAVAAPARAGTYDFTYSGSGAPPTSDFFGTVDDTASGSGSFTTNDANNPVGLSDLASFSFSLSLTYPNDSTNTSNFISPGTDSFTYGLGDLLSFSAAYSGSTLTALSFNTDTIITGDTLNYGEDFTVNGLGAAGAFTTDGDADVLSAGTVSAFVPVPEPTTAALLAAGLVAIGLRRRR